MKIAIIGNSVALRVRPNLQIPDNKNYSMFLREQGLNVDNRAIGAFTVLDVMPVIDSFINSLPQYYIINLGVVDSCSREVPRWFYNMATSGKVTLFTHFLRSLYRNIIAKIRPPLVWIRFKKPWVSERKFKRQYELIIKTLIKETNAHLICLGINLADSRVEKQLPGSRKRQTRYNNIISDLVVSYNQTFINTEDLDSSDYYPDGVHYNINGHKLLAERIMKMIKERETG